MTSTRWAALTIFLGSIVLLFARLGHYALWDDEAITAMTARAVWQTGDTSARVDDHNLLVYRDGLLVRNFKDRYTPPLQFYLFAPFIGLLGDSNFVCRLPIALCGMITVGVLLLWLRRINPSPFIWWAAAVILLTNASFFLYFRQCRYYGLATMFTALVAYLYYNRPGAGIAKIEDGRSKIKGSLTPPSSILHSQASIIAPHSLAWTAGLALALAGLLASQYLNYAAVVVCLVVDYLIWGRNKPFTLRHWLILLLPQLIVGSVVLWIWNPLIQTGGAVYHSTTWVTDRLCVLWWNWRDMIGGCDFVIVPLLAACPLLYFKSGSIWLLRAPLMLIIFVTTIAMVEPISLAKAMNAEVRYLAPALVPSIAIGIVAVAGLGAFKPKIRWTILAISIGTILVEPGVRGVPPVTASSALMYYYELVHPQIESYTPVINWINTNVPSGASIYVQPAYKAYPLMFRAGKAVYAWQLNGYFVIFTPTAPAEGEMPTLTANDASGKPLLSISVVNGPSPTDEQVSDALIAAWNSNPIAAEVAIATGYKSVTLTAVHPNQTLHITATVQHSRTGSLPQTSDNPSRADFRDLPGIHFKGRIAPDYMIRFGTNSESEDLPQALVFLATRGFHYRLINTIHLNWKDLYRPERIWRSFTTVAPKQGEEIYIYQKVSPANPA
jgi:4-amino-4-deoxy-L-arabinose transferase-like glycosyltransferase